ncbi:MAG: NAD-dependent epimerase/dehydratase family protein, partial [bacterium]|nr:NAD-dependent epimerase/dehydratase family protein [bacterium]
MARAHRCRCRPCRPPSCRGPGSARLRKLVPPGASRPAWRAAARVSTPGNRQVPGWEDVRVAKATVTGGAGFIGSNLVRELVAQGRQVTVIDDLSSGYRQNLESLPEIELIEASILEPEAVERS